MSSRPRRANRSSALANTPQTQPTYTPHVYHPQLPPPAPSVPPNPPRPPLPTTPQALYSTYASRLRTGTTLLMQPIIPTASTSTTRATRRGGVVNYVDPGSGDDIPDAGALDSDDSDFQASGGTRTAIRQSTRKMGAGMTVFHAGSGGVVSMPQQQQQFQPPERAELDQSYLGMIPPSKFIKQKPVAPTTHDYP
jgi:chromatin structure-remodeling complex subunit SFH1